MPDDNPLAAGTFCKVCGTRLDSPERPCPFSCKPALYATPRMFPGHRFRGIQVVEAVTWNA